MGLDEIDMGKPDMYCFVCRNMLVNLDIISSYTLVQGANGPLKNVVYFSRLSKNVSNTMNLVSEF